MSVPTGQIVASVTRCKSIPGGIRRNKRLTLRASLRLFAALRLRHRQTNPINNPIPTHLFWPGFTTQENVIEATDAWHESIMNRITRLAVLKDK